MSEPVVCSSSLRGDLIGYNEEKEAYGKRIKEVKEEMERGEKRRENKRQQTMEKKEMRMIYEIKEKMKRSRRENGELEEDESEQADDRIEQIKRRWEQQVKEREKSISVGYFQGKSLAHEFIKEEKSLLLLNERVDKFFFNAKKQSESQTDGDQQEGEEVGGEEGTEDAIEYNEWRIFSLEKDSASDERLNGNANHSTKGRKGKPSGNGFSLFIPQIAFHLKVFNSTVECKGCFKSFPCYFAPGNKQPSPEYYIHCINCKGYKRFDLIRECLECKLTFMTPKGYCRHNYLHHPSLKNAQKPIWMSAKQFKTCKNCAEFTSSIKCIGCGEEFPSVYRKGDIVHSLEYYIHCIENCNKYREMGLISDCKECELKFLTKRGLYRHRFFCQPRREPGPEKPKWMSRAVYERVMKYTMFPDQVICKGCGNGFPARLRKSGRVYSFEYHIHCTEKCKDYKALVLLRKCTECHSTFLNSNAYCKHKCPMKKGQGFTEI